jgi:hypothetical protein
VTKYCDLPMTQEKLAEYVQGAGDFEFELRVLNELSKKGIKCNHGGTYEDSVSGKAREFDIRAGLRKEARKLLLAIECKNLRPSFPMLVSCMPRRADEARHQLQVNCDLGLNPLLQTGTHADWIRTIDFWGASTRYQIGAPVGKSIVRVRQTEKGVLDSSDDTFERWSQAIASAESMMVQSTTKRQPANDPDFVAVLPILVVPERTLWIVEYNADGSISSAPKAVENVSYFVDRWIGKRLDPSYRVSHLEIMTLPGLLAFLQDPFPDVEHSLFPPQGIREAFRKLVQSSGA